MSDGSPPTLGGVPRSTLLTGVVIFVALLVAPMFLGRYYHHILVLSIWYGIIALGLGVLLGFAGQWSFAQLGFTAMAGIAMYWVNVEWAMPYWLSALGIVVLVSLVAVAMAIPAFKAERHYFALITFAYIILIHQLGLALPELTGGGSGLRGFHNPPLFGYSINTIWDFHLLGLVVLALLVTAVYRLRNSDLGRVFIAIRENDKMAENLGVNVYWYKVIAFALAAAFAAFGGILFTSYQNNIDPAFYHPVQSFLIVVMVVIGGVRRIEGWLAGVLIVFLLPEILRSGTTLRFVIFGLVLLAILYVEPRGLVELLRRGLRRMRGERGSATEESTKA